MINISNTLLSDQLLPFLLLALVVAVERFLPWPDKYHPLSFIKALATGMAKKVMSSNEQPIGQQKLSGSLAIIVLLVPMIAILGVLKFLSQYPVFFETLMLLIALRFQNVVKQSNKVRDALKEQKKMLARHALSQIVLRETDKMSAMGMVKANVEALLLRFSFEYCAVVFWYCLTGGIGALVYRLLYELSLCWNTKASRFRYFGLPIRYLVNIFQWVPNKLAVLSVVLAVNIQQGIKALFQRKSFLCEHLFILNVCGASLGIQLGGPAIYQQQKLRIQKCGGLREVVLADHTNTLAAINRATWIWLTIYFLLAAVTFLMSAN
jgi:adenosylcobinamide-phosphate synthase